MGKLEGPFTSYGNIWLIDFEYLAPPGNEPDPVCVVAKELKSGKVVREWLHGNKRPFPLVSTDRDSLYICFFASAEISCHLALRWPVPVYILDLFTEFKNLTNGLPKMAGEGLLGALTYFGLPGIADSEKDSMRNLVLRGAPWTEEEKADILRYCETDVQALEDLFYAMQKEIDLGRALLRGRYMAAVAKMEQNGVPLDTEALDLLKTHWDEIQADLVAAVDKDYDVYEGLTFKQDRFKHYLNQHNISWPHLPSGALDLTQETFKDMARAYPSLHPLKELRHALGQLRLHSLHVGPDGRNRCMLSPFKARTGRNQPSSAKFIFGPSAWLRSLIRPGPGQAISYVDWSQQEFGIAAALSRDTKMQEAYSSGDPYLTFAKQAGAAPPDATKESHKEVREAYKACVLAVQYGMGAASLARRIGQPAVEARELLSTHQATYRKFWKWSDGVQDFAMIFNKLWTVFGWFIFAGREVNPRSLRNYPMQANGSEMLRLAIIMATEAGIKVCAPVHDAILIEAPVSEIEETVRKTREIMARASRIVLNGFELRTDAEIYQHPERYRDDRGRHMWNLVWETIGNVTGDWQTVYNFQ